MRNALSVSLAAVIIVALPRVGSAEGTASPQAVQQPEAEAGLPEMLVSAGRAVVYLRTYDALGKQVGLGSGFLVEKGRVVTNAHVLEGLPVLRSMILRITLLGLRTTRRA